MQEFQLPDVYNVYGTSFWQTLPGYGILVGIAFFMVGCLVVGAQFVRWYLEGTTKDSALRRLKALSERVSAGSSDLGVVYHELTDVVKGFMQWRYMMPKGLTDYELVVWLSGVGCEDHQREVIERLIIEAQAIKFGRLDAPKQQVIKDISAATGFIESAGDPSTRVQS